MPSISVGRIVHYRLSPTNVNTINQRRASLSGGIAGRIGSLFMGGPSPSSGNLAREDQVLPMVVVGIWQFPDPSQNSVNGQVFLDGSDTLWVTGVREGAGPGCWFWPPMT